MFELTFPPLSLRVFAFMVVVVTEGEREDVRGESNKKTEPTTRRLVDWSRGSKALGEKAVQIPMQRPAVNPRRNMHSLSLFQSAEASKNSTPPGPWPPQHGVLAKNPKIDEIDMSISSTQVSLTQSRKNEISDISPWAKCVIQMEMSNSRISCIWNGARRSS